MEHLLFVGYLILFAWLVTKIKFFVHSGLTSSQLIILFLLKVMAGIFYGWIGIYYSGMAQMIDTWGYHNGSIQEARLLQQQPIEFFSSLFRNTYQQGYGGFLASENSWWNDLHSNFLIKFLALFQILSFENYYINVIFFSFCTFFGPVALYRVMMHEFPAKKIAILLTTFLIPSFLYWTSGINKDGLIFLGLGLIVFHFYFGLKNGFGFFRIVVILICFIFILALRNYLLFIILPALLAWGLAAKLPYKKWIVYSTLYLLYILFFFTARYIHPRLDLPGAVVAKQQAFQQLKGGSEVPVKQLKPDFLSFLQNAPQALNLTIVRPYPSDVIHLLSLAAAVETGFLILLFLLFFIYRRNGIAIDSFLLFCLFFSFSVLLTIGYTVPFLGATVRYRSIVLPFLFVPIAAQIHWERIGAMLQGEIKNKNNI